MMTPQQWNVALSPAKSFTECQSAVFREAVKVLRDIPADYPLSTNELADMLYPPAFAHGEGITARRRLFETLFRLAKNHMKSRTSRGAPRRVHYAGKRIFHTNNSRTICPILWHQPTEEPVTCSTH